MYISNPLSRGDRELEKLPCLKYYSALKRENRLTLGLRLPKIVIIRKKKKHEVKVVENSIPDKKLSGRTCLSPPRVELRRSKDCNI